MNVGIATLACSILFADLKTNPTSEYHIITSKILIPDCLTVNISQYRPVNHILLRDIHCFSTIFDIKVGQANIWRWKFHRKGIIYYMNRLMCKNIIKLCIPSCNHALFSLLAYTSMVVHVYVEFTQWPAGTTERSRAAGAVHQTL